MKANQMKANQHAVHSAEKWTSHKFSQLCFRPVALLLWCTWHGAWRCSICHVSHRFAEIGSGNNSTASRRTQRPASPARADLLNRFSATSFRRSGSSSLLGRRRPSRPGHACCGILARETHQRAYPVEQATLAKKSPATGGLPVHSKWIVKGVALV
jgi:hypothetical protein